MSKVGFEILLSLENARRKTKLTTLSKLMRIRCLCSRSGQSLDHNLTQVYAIHCDLVIHLERSL